MELKKYHLYLDESESHNNDRTQVSFCLAGIIIEESKLSALEDRLIKLKESIWSTSHSNPQEIILHELEVRKVQKRNKKVLAKIDPIFHCFKNRKNSKILYDGLSNIIKDLDCKIIGAALHRQELENHFKKTLVSTDYLIAFQIILENFCHFLDSVDGVGEVFYESQNFTTDGKIRKHYNQIKSNGSMFINAVTMQKHLKEIEFPNKLENIPGLQVADFVPNNFARNILGFYHHEFNINGVLRKQRYDGSIEKRERFGVKYMP
ncbi:DUF3800 domain-containing protein [Lysinibacillus sphaericus]|uniref:DUF3800 domain-containing protein n=1 Tax=Lysinibacillus sphaericus TaxID=1421 RepID=UPI003D7F6295